MIRLVDNKEELYRALGNTADIFAGKIRAYAEGYGFGYYFCSFWVQDSSAVICAYYNDAVAAQTGELSDEAAEELTMFLSGQSFARVLMPDSLCGRLGLAEQAEELCLMEWANDVKKPVEYDKEAVKTNSSLIQIYEIVSSAFDIDFEKWYTDTSYMLRHGISEVYTLENSACAIKMYSSEGVTYLSYVCVKPECRGRGLAHALLHYICTDETARGDRTFIICEEELTGFYESAGFTKTGRVFEMSQYAK